MEGVFLHEHLQVCLCLFVCVHVCVLERGEERD